MKTEENAKQYVETAWDDLHNPPTGALTDKSPGEWRYSRLRSGEQYLCCDGCLRNTKDDVQA